MTCRGLQFGGNILDTTQRKNVIHTYIHTYIQSTHTYIILYLNTEGTINIKILTIYKRRKK